MSLPFSTEQKSLTTDTKRCQAALCPWRCVFRHCVAFVGGTRGKTRHGKSKVHSACSSAKRPVVSHQCREKNNRASAREQFGKRTSQGRIQLAQHVPSAVSNGGRARRMWMDLEMDKYEGNGYRIRQNNILQCLTRLHYLYYSD